MLRFLNRASFIGGWPAAKYLPYAFWRAWFLVMYSSPLWLLFALPDGAAPALHMHYVSTACFVAASVTLAVCHVRAVGLLSSKPFIVLCGVGASAGVVLEFAALALFHTPSCPLFWVGAALTGLGTAPIALRAGQIYAASRIATAVTATLLSDVAAGLIFFFAVGTWPAIGLLIAVALPLLAALTLVAASPGGDDADDAASPDSPHAPVRPFAYFLVAAFLIGGVAFLQNSLGSSWFSQANIDEGSILGVSLLIFVSFGLAVIFAAVRSVRLEALYRPVILFLSACVLVAYLLNLGSPAAIGGTLLAYCLFSSFVWVLMAYLGHGRYFSPVQVFGYGRAVYAAGSLVGGLVGVYLLPYVGTAQGIPATAVAMVGILLLCAVAIRPRDLASILALSGEGREHMAAQGIASQSGESGESGRAAGFALAGDGRQSGEGALASGDALRAPSMSDPSSAASAADGASGAPEGLTLRIYPKTSPVALAAEAKLSPREMEVFALMRAGRDAAYIAESLCVSRNTAKTHIRNIYGKFGVHTRQEFVDIMQGK